ncbi:MarR family winged helix-turn-helix transcriptional regulator [Amycolatopsis sp. NPDC059021]|uniref:MarR family winged helix-turn-helix transcriptional regulator n=1 Tax=Amycolatopsis sp. NPDC059021 TaxID=3346704 RepID=UPI0036734FA5
MEQPDPGAAAPPAARGGPISHTIFRVARLHRMLAGQLLRQAGLHPGQELLMMHLWEAGPQRQTDLVAVLGSDSATVTRTVTRLERSGFVRRTSCPHDRRVTIVTPTPASLALRREVEEIWRRLEDLTADGLTTGERDTALDVLERLERNLAEATAERCARTSPPRRP